ncbi:SURP and G-patch domain-containing protein 1-like isoform X2 [Glandiceps talaboti]
MAHRPPNLPPTHQPFKPAHIADQEKLIEQKKKEIEKRMEEQRKREEEQAAQAKAKKPTEIKFQIKPAQNVQAKTEPVNSNNTNIFSNDGSFMEQFMKMQQQMKKQKDEVKTEKLEKGSPEKPSISSSTESVQPQKKLPFIGKKFGTKSLSGLMSQMKRTPTSTVSRTKLSRSDVFEVDDNDVVTQKEKQIVSPPEDAETAQVVEQLAEFVAEGGSEVEEIAMERNRENPAFWFLYDPSSQEFKYYKFKLKQLRSKFEEKSQPSTESAEVSVPKPSGKRARKSRWGNWPKEEGDGEGDGEGEGEGEVVYKEPDDIPAEEVAAAMQVNPVGMIGTSVLTTDQQRQLKEQQEMQRMYESIRAKQEGGATSSSADSWARSEPGPSHSHSSRDRKRRRDRKPKYEYDSDEDIDGGTWEHKKRANEMGRTQLDADNLTKMNKGKHFIGDFLPKEELDKFMETVKALKDGGEPDLSDYREYKLKQDNIGYQMLQKAGWKEGEGLGSEGQGRKDPINKGKTAMDASGLGTEKPGDLQSEDDEFELFRKRMMLAYRFRPNPLNNPRRPYY